MTKDRACANTSVSPYLVALAPMAAVCDASPSNSKASLPALKGKSKDVKSAAERLGEFAEITKTKLPPLELDAKGKVELTEELYDYMTHEGASFDWIFRGDLSAMVLSPKTISQVADTRSI